MSQRIFQQDAKASTNDTEDLEHEVVHIKHTRLGIWDLYEDRSEEVKRGFSLSRFQPFIRSFDEILTSFPFVVRAFKTFASLCLDKMIIYLAASLLRSLLPAVRLHFSAQLLQVVQESIDSRNIDKQVLFGVMVCNITCAVLSRVLDFVDAAVSQNISHKMRMHFAERILRANVRLDVPSFEDPVLKTCLKMANSSSNNAAWRGIQAIIGIATTAVQLISQISVLMHVLRGQPENLLLGLLTFADPILIWLRTSDLKFHGAWMAICRDADFMRMKGLQELATNRMYRKELVAGNLQEHIVSDFKMSQERAREVADMPFGIILHERHKRRVALSPLSYLNDIFHELPQVVFTLRAVESPRSIPVSLASMAVIRQTVSSFSTSLLQLLGQTSSISQIFAYIRNMYEIVNLENQVVDGTEPYPENKQLARNGIALEFRNVSFKYPESDKYAIQNVTFDIKPGQLCVLVGFNGSGKSTILKLITRLYDPTEGVILVDGRDIRTLKLSDLRNCIAVLFQDYTHFPLSIRENIGMGNPRHAADDDMIRQAAELGGATEIIESLPEGFDTRLEIPWEVEDQYSVLPLRPRSFPGREITHNRLRRSLNKHKKRDLSGGQLQRLAVSRTFMRSLGDDSDVGLLLFDEPSASLDPTAEHDLFERLCQLRGNKTMVFSSHRFGQLTRLADKNLYMEQSKVLELGTHDELLKLDGGYSKMYRLQASQFK